jgi:membrane protein required for beta-lactamase induction
LLTSIAEFPLSRPSGGQHPPSLQTTINDPQILQNKPLTSTLLLSTITISSVHIILNIIQLVNFNTFTLYYKIVIFILNNLVHSPTRNVDIHSYYTLNMNDTHTYQNPITTMVSLILLIKELGYLVTHSLTPFSSRHR